MVAVAGYDPHPITRNVSFTFYPGIRALDLTPPAQGIQVLPLISSSGDSYTMPVAAVAQRQLEPAPLVDAALSRPRPGRRSSPRSAKARSRRRARARSGQS